MAMAAPLALYLNLYRSDRIVGVTKGHQISLNIFFYIPLYALAHILGRNRLQDEALQINSSNYRRVL